MNEPQPQKEYFKVGDWVKTSPDSEYSYEVAALKQFPHGIMVGIYDEPPSNHIDYWHSSSLQRSPFATTERKDRHRTFDNRPNCYRRTMETRPLNSDPPSAAEKLIEKPVEETETWKTFADYFEKHEGFKPHPKDSRAKELYNYYCVGLFDASRHSGQAVDARPVTDAEVDEFMREYHEGKHPLSPELEAALKEMGPRLFAEIRDVINRGKPEPSGQAVGRQEWTERLLKQLDPAGRENDAETERRRKLLNAALAAEAIRSIEAMTRVQQQVNDMAQELNTERDRTFAVSRHLEDAKKQLLSAQAAIEKEQFHIISLLDYLESDDGDDAEGVQILVDKVREVLRDYDDLSLLHKHDAELTEKVRRALVEALEQTHELWRLASDQLNQSDDAVHRVRFLDLHDPIGKINSALAQCKQP